MDISAHTSLLTSATSAQTIAPEDLQRATREFEAVFLRQFLGEALKPLLHNTPGSQSTGAHFYQYMVTDAIAGSLAEQESFGFSSLLRLQLQPPSSSNESHSST